jgi:hypothetical protein
MSPYTSEHTDNQDTQDKTVIWQFFCVDVKKYCRLSEEHNSLVAESSVLIKIVLCLLKKIKTSVKGECYTAREVMTSTEIQQPVMGWDCD